MSRLSFWTLIFIRICITDESVYDFSSVPFRAIFILSLEDLEWDESISSGLTNFVFFFGYVEVSFEGKEAGHV
jgi:hypothetical protein